MNNKYNNPSLISIYELNVVHLVISLHHNRIFSNDQELYHEIHDHLW